MDHSEHSIHNHGTHGSSGHIMAVSSTAATPIDVMTLEDGSGIFNPHSVHETHETGSGGHDMMHHMMSMAFHFGYNETVLFSWWKIDSVLGLLGSMFAIFIMAVFYEGLKYYREYLFWKTYNLLEYRPVTGPQGNNTEAQQRRAVPTSSASPVQYVGEVIHKQPPTMLSLNHLYQTLLHAIQVTVSFMLMLIFMTYNVWLCIPVVLGAAVGYFLFCWKKSVIVDVTEHCH